MTNYSMSVQHRRWIVAALLMLLMTQSYFLGGYTDPADWDSLPGRMMFVLGGLAFAFLAIELLRYFSAPVAAWTHARQLALTPLLAIPVLVAQGILMHPAIQA